MPVWRRRPGHRVVEVEDCGGVGTAPDILAEQVVGHAADDVRVLEVIWAVDGEYGHVLFPLRSRVFECRGHQGTISAIDVGDVVGGHLPEIFFVGGAVFWL